MLFFFLNVFFNKNLLLKPMKMQMLLNSSKNEKSLFKTVTPQQILTLSILVYNSPDLSIYKPHEMSVHSAFAVLTHFPLKQEVLVLFVFL